MLIQTNDHRAIQWHILVLYVLCGMHAPCHAAYCASAESQLGAPQHPQCIVARLTPYITSPYDEEEIRKLINSVLDEKAQTVLVGFVNAI